MRTTMKCLLLQFFTMVIACNTADVVKYNNVKQDGDNYIVKMKFDKSGNLISEERLTKDSIRDGFYKEYVHGRIKCSGYFDNKIKDSTWTYYTQTGAVIGIENWFNGKRFGEQLQFYDVPNTSRAHLLKYTFNNIGGDELFEASFNRQDAAQTFKGVPLYIAYNSDSIKANSNFELMCFFGVPASFTYEMQICELDPNRKRQESFIRVSDTTSSLQKLYFARKYFEFKTYKKRGVYDWKINFLLMDSLKNVLVNDSSTIQLKVF